MSEDPNREVGVAAEQVIAGKYRLEDMLGRGGMGSVWRAENLELGSHVALKILKPEIGKNANSRARFLREARAAALLRSPHVVQILEHGTDGNVVFIAMELLEGESLFSRLKRERRLTPRLTETVMTHVARAMAKAHELGVVHRDLKPDNIFLVSNDDEIIAKVLDFGIAKLSIMQLASTAESPYTQTGALLGTPYYMSPEQATGEKQVDHRADLWALGVIAFECLVGQRPYQSDSLGDLVLQICSKPQPVPSSLAPVPQLFDDWFAKAQKRIQTERFQSAKELARELSAALASSVRAPSSASDGAHTATTHPPLPMHQALDATTPIDGRLVASSAAGGGSVDPPPARAFTPQVATDRHFPPREAERADAPIGETMDAFAATTSSRRRPWLLGVAAAALALTIVGAIGWQLARSGSDSGVTAASAPVPEVVPPPAPADVTPSAEPTDEPWPPLAPVEPSGAPSSAAAPQSKTPAQRPGASPPSRTVPRPPSRPSPQGSSQQPTKQPPKHDPLAI